MSQPSAQPSVRPVLVIVSPLPNRRNGIADYAAVLLDRLSKHYECLCVVQDVGVVDADLHRFAEIISHREYVALAPGLRGERHLYHIGNNIDSVPAIDELMQAPGVVMLHDLTLHYLMERWSETRFGDPAAIADVVRLLHGPLAEDLLGLRRVKAPLVSPYFETNCLPVLRDAARAVITHSAYGLVSLRAAGYTAPVHVIPHFADPPELEAQAAQRSAWRRRLGVQDDTLLFTSLGFVTPNKQIPKVLEALAQLPQDVGDWRYVIGGENRDPLVARTVERFGLEGRVVQMDYLSEQDFDELLAASDLMVNLRFPTSGETSGSVCRALGFGLPCVVSSHGWYTELPAEACFRIPPTTDIVSDLRQMFLRVLLAPSQLRARGLAARDYAEKFLALDRVVLAYCAAIEAAHDGGQAAPMEVCARGAEVLLLPPAPVLLQTSDLETALAQLLAAECATVDGLPTRRAALAGVRPPPRPERGAEAGTEQLFVALNHDLPFVGKLFTLLSTAHDRLSLGDLLTVAILCDRPDGAELGVGDTPLKEALELALESFGFAPLRVQDRQISPDAVEDPYGRIVLATARKDTARPPSPRLFLSSLGACAFPFSAVSDRTPPAF